LFWSGKRKLPKTISYDESNELHRNCLKATQQVLCRLVPEAGKIEPQEFDKDDAVHLGFVYSFSLIYAHCYDIHPADQFRAKRIAGRIIPAIITTTSMVSGMMCLNLYRIMLKSPVAVTQLVSTQVDTAVGSFLFFPPANHSKFKFKNQLADVVVYGELSKEETIGDFVRNFKRKFNVQIDTIKYDMPQNPVLLSESLQERYSDIMDTSLFTIITKLRLFQMPQKHFRLWCGQEFGDLVLVKCTVPN